MWSMMCSRVHVIDFIAPDPAADGRSAVSVLENRPEARAEIERTLRDALREYELETDEPFPQEASKQLSEVLRSMARAWEGSNLPFFSSPRKRPVLRYLILESFSGLSEVNGFGR